MLLDLAALREAPRHQARQHLVDLAPRRRPHVVDAPARPPGRGRTRSSRRKRATPAPSDRSCSAPAWSPRDVPRITPLVALAPQPVSAPRSLECESLDRDRAVAGNQVSAGKRLRDPQARHNADVRTPVSLALAAIAVALAAASAGASSKADSAGALARAFAIKVVVPGQSGAVGAAGVGAARRVQRFGDGLRVPERTARWRRPPARPRPRRTSDVGANAAWRARPARRQPPSRSSAARSRPTSVSGPARGSTLGRQRRASGGVGGSTVNNLVVLGQPVAAAPNAHVTLGDWGYADDARAGAPRHDAGRVAAQAFRRLRRRRSTST